MTKELYSNSELRFCLSDEFKMEYLEPVGKYVNWKLQNGWDDYNELYHATEYFTKAMANKNVWIHSHLMMNKSDLACVALIVGGNLKSVENRIEIQNEEKSLLLKYFHIVDKGKGNGQKWLKEIIFPFYKNLEYQHFYIGSSHPKSFALYEKFGHCIYDYNLLSDNNLHERIGKIFRIDLSNLTGGQIKFLNKTAD